MKDVEASMIMHFAELITKEGIPPRLQELQFSALRELQAQLQYYAKRGYHKRLITGIAEKKAALILKTTSKADIDKVMHPRAPHYNGAEFVPDEFSIPEEELICWSETSLRGPLNSAGLKRYRALFEEIFSQEGESMGID
ncbi:MAG: hypothetical protein IKP72_06955 [Clostridia bacterium]|nr:hypothetical protein [Clostridia bacterium]